MAAHAYSADRLLPVLVREWDPILLPVRARLVRSRRGREDRDAAGRPCLMARTYPVRSRQFERKPIEPGVRVASRTAAGYQGPNAASARSSRAAPVRAPRARARAQGSSAGAQKVRDGSNSPAIRCKTFAVAEVQLPRASIARARGRPTVNVSSGRAARRARLTRASAFQASVDSPARPDVPPLGRRPPRAAMDRPEYTQYVNGDHAVRRGGGVGGRGGGACSCRARADSRAPWTPRSAAKLTRHHLNATRALCRQRPPFAAARDPLKIEAVGPNPLKLGQLAHAARAQQQWPDGPPAHLPTCPPAIHPIDMKGRWQPCGAGRRRAA